MKDPKLTVLGPAIALGAVLAFLGYEMIGPRWTSAPPEEPVQAASKVSIGGPFSLIDHRGQPFTDRDLEGRVRLVFFGFTSCPDVCPTALTLMSELLGELDPTELDQIRPIFVTVDPERDTLEVMKDYMSMFHPSIVGLTGSPSAVDAMTKAYKVYYSKKPTEDGKDYTMNHSAGVYLFDRQGEFRSTLDLHEDPAVVRAKLRRIVEES